MSFFAYAQPDTLSVIDTLSEKPAVRTLRNQWGVRVNFRVGQSYDNTITLVEGTYQICKKHELTAGMMVNFVGNHGRSPLLGAHISYHYSLLRHQRFLVPYGYYSGDIGSYEIISTGLFFLGYQNGKAVTAYGEITNSRLIFTNTLGAGVEFRFGDHFYGNLAAGLSVLYTSEHWKHRFENPPLPVRDDYTVNDIRPGMEIKAGFGWRF